LVIIQRKEIETKLELGRRRYDEVLGQRKERAAAIIERSKEVASRVNATRGSTPEACLLCHAEALEKGMPSESNHNNHRDADGKRSQAVHHLVSGESLPEISFLLLMSIFALLLRIMILFRFSAESGDGENSDFSANVTKNKKRLLKLRKRIASRLSPSSATASGPKNTLIGKLLESLSKICPDPNATQLLNCDQNAFGSLEKLATEMLARLENKVRIINCEHTGLVMRHASQLTFC
jgi:hypothetical protein